MQARLLAHCKPTLSSGSFIINPTVRHRHGSKRSRKDEGKGPAWHLEKMWKLGWEVPCRAPSRVPSTVRLLWAYVPRAPSHPLDSPAEFTSLTRSPLPPQGRSLPGTFEQGLGMQSEADIRRCRRKGREGKKGAQPQSLQSQTQP